MHDDVEDGSEFRRGKITLMRARGVPVAINVGDATNVLAIEPLLGNTMRIGTRKALLVFREIERMAAIHRGTGDRAQLDRRGTLRSRRSRLRPYGVQENLLVHRDRSAENRRDLWIAARTAAPLEDELTQLVELGFLAGIAFQIHDDLLNLEADEGLYGKESSGDLWEGKRTIMLLHYLRTAVGADRERALALLEKPRREKQAEDVRWLLEAMRAAGSLQYGRELAIEYSQRALEVDARGLPFFVDNDDRRFLREMLHYVIDRAK